MLRFQGGEVEGNTWAQAVQNTVHNLHKPVNNSAPKNKKPLGITRRLFGAPRLQTSGRAGAA